VAPGITKIKSADHKNAHKTPPPPNRATNTLVIAPALARRRFAGRKLDTAPELGVADEVGNPVAVNWEYWMIEPDTTEREGNGGWAVPVLKGGVKDGTGVVEDGRSVESTRVA